MYKGERFNSISHLVGASFALAGGALLVTRAAMEGDSIKVMSFSVYGITLFAGAHTPFITVALKGALGWWMFGTIWALALFGVILETPPRPGVTRGSTDCLRGHGLALRVRSGPDRRRPAARGLRLSCWPVEFSTPLASFFHP